MLTQEYEEEEKLICQKHLQFCNLSPLQWAFSPQLGQPCIYNYSLGDKL